MTMLQNPCYNCFAERNTAESDCPCCSYENTPNKQNYSLALEQGSVLNSRYLIGRVFNQDVFGITYLSLDQKRNRKVVIKE